MPPVVVVGTPGLGYDYMENFEALTVSDRRVRLCPPRCRAYSPRLSPPAPAPTRWTPIPYSSSAPNWFSCLPAPAMPQVVEVTFAGSSADAKGTPVPLLSVGACAAQLQAAIRALNVPAVHVAAHGLGAGAAVALARAQPTLIRSLALISPYGSLSDLRPASADTLRSERDSLSVAATILRTRTLLAKNSCVREAADASGGPLLSRLLSGSDGDMRLGGAALGEALVGCDIPVFLATGGEADLVELDWTGLPPSVTRRAFSLSGHLPFIDQREDFLIAYADFLDATDGVTTNRELKFADPVTTLKELASERPLGAPPKDCSVFKTDAARAYCEKSR